MTDRGCLRAIASRSGEAGGESRSHKFGLFWSIGVVECWSNGNNKSQISNK
jgi:hypothetical protein